LEQLDLESMQLAEKLRSANTYKRNLHIDANHVGAELKHLVGQKNLLGIDFATNEKDLIPIVWCDSPQLFFHFFKRFR